MYDEDENQIYEEEYDESKLTNIEFEKNNEVRGEITKDGVVSFRYNGLDYEIAIEITESWDRQNSTSDFSVEVVEDIPREIEDIWYDMEDDILSEIKNDK